jgi:peptidoglycan/LPS O-acetylase OafA/YrhL
MPSRLKYFPVNRQGDRIPVVDGVRFLSIFLVMGHHFFITGASGGYSPALWHLILKFFGNGPYGVTCFFVVSGFVITRMLAGTRGFSSLDLKGFYARRAGRIFPLLAVILIVGLLVLQFHPAADYRMALFFRDTRSQFGWDFWISILTFTFNWHVILKSKISPISYHWGVLWSLAVEEQFYLFYPLLVRSLKRQGRIVTFLWMVVVSGILFRTWVYYEVPGNNLLSSIASFGTFDQIALGALVYFFSPAVGKLSKRNGWLPYFLLAIGMAFFGAIYFGTSFRDTGDLILGPTLLAMGCALVILGGLQVKGFTSLFWRVLSWPGKLSYGCYLWHTTVLFFLWPLLHATHGLIALVLFVLSTWVWAAGSYYGFEIPANNRVRAFFGIGPSHSL